MPAPIITPSGPVELRDGLEFLNLTSDQDVVWTTDGGTLSLVLARSVRWIAPKRTGIFHVTGTNGTAQATIVVVDVIVTFEYGGLYLADFNHPIDAKKKILSFEPEDGDEVEREKSGTRHYWQWSGGENGGIDYDMIMFIRRFWDYHHPGKPFYVYDPILNERRLCKTDSDLSFSENVGADSFNWKGNAKEVWPYGSV